MRSTVTIESELLSDPTEREQQAFVDDNHMSGRLVISCTQLQELEFDDNQVSSSQFFLRYLSELRDHLLKNTQVNLLQNLT